MKQGRAASAWRSAAASLVLLLGLSVAGCGRGPDAGQSTASGSPYWKSKVGQSCTISYRNEPSPGATTRVGRLKEVQERWVVIEATEPSLVATADGEPQHVEIRREYCIPIDAIADVSFDLP